MILGGRGNPAPFLFLLLLALTPQALAQSPSPEPTSAAPPQRPRITTQSPDGRTVFTYRPGDQFVLNGELFDTGAEVTIAFEQSSTTPLGSVPVGEDGTFRRELRIPGDARPGSATVRASTSVISATAAVQITGASEETESLTALWPWVAALVVIVAIGSLVWRWRRPGRDAVVTDEPDIEEADEEPEEQEEAGSESSVVRKLRTDVDTWRKKT